MTPAEIADLAASAMEREIENMKRNPIVKKIVADMETNEGEMQEDIHNLEAEISARVEQIAALEAENEQLKADVAELKSRLAEPPKKRATK